MNTSSDRKIEKPILRWAGGKGWLLKELHKFLPQTFINYHEPFLGGASVFFYIQPNGKSYLSDTNRELINSYREIRDNVNEVIKTLKKFKNSKEEYYKIRETKLRTSVKKAAQFIYLNRTGFNGIYRVNALGKYNVPYGFKKYKQLFDFERLRRVSHLLKTTKLTFCDFEISIKNIKEGDLVFLDPPYTVSNTKNCFIKYNEKLFSLEDQKRLANYINEVVERNAFYILTNAHHPLIKELFGKINYPITITRANVIGGKKAKRGIIKEFIFTNTI